MEKLVVAVAVCPEGVLAVTAKVCVPFENKVESRVEAQPTFGQPDRPGYAPQTSARDKP